MIKSTNTKQHQQPPPQQYDQQQQQQNLDVPGYLRDSRWSGICLFPYSAVRQVTIAAVESAEPRTPKGKISEILISIRDGINRQAAGQYMVAENGLDKKTPENTKTKG